MRIFVKAKPNAKEEYVERIDETHFIVAVKEQAKQGRANKAITKVLANYFHANPKLISGFTSRQKVFEINK